VTSTDSDPAPYFFFFFFRLLIWAHDVVSWYRAGQRTAAHSNACIGLGASLICHGQESQTPCAVHRRGPHDGGGTSHALFSRLCARLSCPRQLSAVARLLHRCCCWGAWLVTEQVKSENYCPKSFQRLCRAVVTIVLLYLHWATRAPPARMLAMTWRNRQCACI